ncbi:MAG TPA: DUF6531 domain-containing protein [Frankiaceae bacterium]|nr:DUF6531 domain-containing protein [Frankiaceae bacterium]
MGVTSASPDDLARFVSGGARLSGAVESGYSGAATASAVVRGASPDYYTTTNAVERCGALLQALRTNDRFVQVVHDALVDADRYDGSPTVRDSAIESALASHGLLGRPAVVEVEKMSLYGIAPTSGFVDDPICAANGNFVHGDEDVTLPGYAGCLSVVRMYNSLAHDQRGAFGWGWSSVLDRRVTADEATARVSLADGAVVTFHEVADGEYERDVRRGLTLSRTGEGWTLRQGHTESWEFDEAGELVAFASGMAVARVERDGSGVRITEERSGRWVAYELAGDLVTQVTTSDGRTCEYEYAAGHLVGVSRAIGGVTYRVEDGFVTVVEDADGVALCRNTYDPEGRVLSQVTPHGRTTTYEYGELGTTRIGDTADGPVNVMVHDRRGNVTAVIDGDGNAMRLDYDADGHVTRLVDRTGAETRYAYDAEGLLTERTDPDDLAHRWEWDELGRLVREVDRAGSETTYSYDGSRRVPAVVVEPGGATVRTTYDDRELPVEVVDPDGVTTAFEWDRDGQLTAIVDGAGARTSFAHDERGRLVEAANASGDVARFVLDDAGRVVETHTAAGVETYEYTPGGRVVSGTVPGGAAWSAAYDAAGEVARLVDPAGGVLALTRDTAGNVTTFTAPDGTAYGHVYDAVGRLVEAVDAAGNATRLTYDAEGRSVAVVDASGREWRRGVDPFGRTTTLTGPDGATVTRTYHPNGELASTTDADGRTWEFRVDEAGRLVAATDPAGATATFDHTPAGRLLRERSPMGRVVTYAYDEAGRPASVTAPDGTVVPYTDRRETGRPAAAFDWDPRGLLSRATDPAGVATDFGYDVRGRLKEQVTGGAVRRFGYDATGWVDSVTDPLGNVTSMLNDAVGRVLEVRLPDGRELRYERTAAGAPEALFAADGTELVRMAYDRAGRVAASGPTRLDRDEAGRVVGVTAAAGAVRYGRDLDGNVVTRTDETGFVVEWLRGDSGALVEFGTPAGRVGLPGPSTADRDDAGRVVADELGRVYRYDDAGRLAESVTPGGTRTAYEYGPFGLLAAETGDTGTRRYDYDVAGRLVRRVADGAETTYYYDAAGRRVAAGGSDGVRVRYAWDDLDRLVRIDTTAADGTERTQRITYDGFDRPVVVDGVDIGWDLTGKPVRVGDERYLRYGGQVRLATADGEWSTNVPDDPWGDDGRGGVRIGYRGELALDGLVLMGARVYDTEARCFLSPDPAEPVPGALTFAGPYSYAWNDPVNFVDPSGLRPLSDTEYAEIRRRQEQGVFEKAWESMVEDPWGTLAMVGVVALGVGLVVFAGPVLAAAGTGILLASGVSAGLGLVTGSFNPRSVALNGIVGGFVPGGGLVRTAATGLGIGAGYSVLDQVVVQGKGLDEIDLVAVGRDSVISGVSFGVAKKFFSSAPRTRNVPPREASIPVGRRGSPMNVPRGTNAPAVINGRLYGGHALDEMMSEGIVPSVVDDAIANGIPSTGKSGRVGYYSQDNHITVVTENGKVITVSSGRLKIK